MATRTWLVLCGLGWFSCGHAAPVWADETGGNKAPEALSAAEAGETASGQGQNLNLGQGDHADGPNIEITAWTQGTEDGVPVPEPMTALLSAIGVVYLWSRRRTS